MSTPRYLDQQRRQRAVQARYEASKGIGRVLLAGAVVVALALLVGEVAEWLAELAAIVAGLGG